MKYNNALIWWPLWHLYTLPDDFFVDPAFPLQHVYPVYRYRNTLIVYDFHHQIFAYTDLFFHRSYAFSTMSEALQLKREGKMSIPAYDFLYQGIRVNYDHFHNFPDMRNFANEMCAYESRPKVVYPSLGQVATGIGNGASSALTCFLEWGNT